MRLTRAVSSTVCSTDAGRATARFIPTAALPQQQRGSYPKYLIKLQG